MQIITATHNTHPITDAASSRDIKTGRWSFFTFLVFSKQPFVPTNWAIHFSTDGASTPCIADTLLHACLQPPKTCPYFTHSVSHPSYPQSPLPGPSACTHRRRRRRWRQGWPSAGWGKFLDRVLPHPPGSQCCEPRPTWRVLALLSLKLREKCFTLFTEIHLSDHSAHFCTLDSNLNAHCWDSCSFCLNIMFIYIKYFVSIFCQGQNHLGP